ncbi:MAG: HlyC/CorC family transporter [Bacteriovoracaceae bacterium]|nr:HlyC/CorC family transporter [Bacteriovoracaceae bacterium]
MFNPTELISLLACFILSAFFSGSEAVLLSIGIDRAKQLIEEGGVKGKTMKFMVDFPNEILNTILIGNNISNILASSLVTTVAARYFHNEAIAYSVGITTFIILIFGEIIPKTFARTHAESLSIVVINILRFLYYAIWPLVRLMVFVIEKMLGENAEIHGRLVTKDDIEYMVNKAEKENTMDSKQLDLLTSVMEFPTIKVKDIMIPRNRVKALQDSYSYKDIVELVSDDNHSRYPVCHGSLDHTLGFLHVKDLALIVDRENFCCKDHLKEPFFVYEHMKIQAVFDHMNRKKVHLALVKDENGLIVGIVTLEDIVEEIFGDIQDEHDAEEEGPTDENIIFDLQEGIEVDGSELLRDLYNEYDIKIPLNDNFSTLAGFILDMLGNNFPEEGQIIVWEGYSFELTKVDDFEIRKMQIKDVDGEKHIFSKREARDGDDSDD